MRRFNYDDNEDYREDVDNFFDEEDEEEEGTDISPEEYKVLIEEEQALQQLQLEIVHRELDDRMLFKITKMLEKSFWWRFYSLDTKLKMIEKTYRRMKKISERE